MREQLGFAAQQQQSQVVHGYRGLEVLISQASMINLALLLRAKGRYEEAEPPLRQALEICRAQLGEQHPNTLTAVGNLAELLQAQGRYEQAEVLGFLIAPLCRQQHRQAVDRRRHVAAPPAGPGGSFGVSHPDTVDSKLCSRTWKSAVLAVSWLPDTYSAKQPQQCESTAKHNRCRVSASASREGMGQWHFLRASGRILHSHPSPDGARLQHL